MAWQDLPKKRGYPCNGALVRHHRRLRRWTQEDLADVTKFTTRLIAKAEAGGNLHPDSIEILAAALSTSESPLYPEDLIVDSKQLALDFLQSLKLHQGQVVSNCQHLLAERIEFLMPGNPDIIPFAGKHLGLDEMDRACSSFFETLEIIDPQLWKVEFCVCEGSEVVVGQSLQAQLKGLQAQGISLAVPVFIVNRFLFERGKLVRLDDYYNVLDTERELDRQRTMLPEGG